MIDPLSTDAMDVTETARRLGRSRRTVLRWIRSGLLPAVKLGGSWVTSEAAIQEASKRSTPAATGLDHIECQAILAWRPRDAR